MTATTTLESGDNDPTLDAGIFQPASLGDYVWEDLNGNGIQDDGDTGVEGITVNLKDEAGDVIETTTTGADGSYSFDDLDPGTYSVQFVLPDEYEYSPLNVGDDALDSDADPVQDGMTETVTLESGDEETTLDAGVYLPASLGDYVWEDLNANGIQDDGDTGVEGVTVNLKDEAGDVIETTTTEADGSYNFEGLDPGTYSVQFELPDGFVFSPLNVGDDALDSDANPTADGMTATTTLESGDNDPTLDAGIYQTTSLGDYVWNDLNFNGIQDDGDTGVEGVTVNLKDESGAVIETTTTGADGSYSFDDLVPGTYSVQFVLPDGFVFSPLNVGDDALDSDADPAQDGMTATTTLASGENDPTLDAGINKQIDLELIKRVSNVSPNVGETITFTIAVNNLGPNNATGVSVEDIVPNGYSNISNISDGGSNDNGTITWDNLTIANGGNIELAFDVVVNEPGEGIDYVNIAEITDADQIDSDSEPGNGADTNGNGQIGPLDDDGSQDEEDEDDGDDARISPQQIDLELIKSVSNALPNVGEVITFTIEVSNIGPDDATGVAIEDIVPNGYSAISNISDDGDLSGSTITWSGLSINNGGSISLSFDAVVNEPGDGVNYVNLAEVKAADQDDVDSEPGNGADTDGDGNVGPLDPDGSQDADDEDDGDDAGITPQQIDLQLVKSVSNGAPNVGEVVTFTILVDNLGPNDATGVAVQDIVPNGYSAITNISDGGDPSGNTINWTGLNIASGGNISLSFDATVNEPGEGVEYTNIAEVTAADQDDVDSTPNNGADTDGDGDIGPLDPDGSQDADDEDDGDDAGLTPQQIDLQLIKSVSNAEPNVGEVITFTVKVDNLGPNNATGVAIEDLVPNGYSAISNISNDGSLEDGTLTWTGLSINSGGSVSLTYNAVVNEPGEGINYTNLAQVTAADQDDVDSTPGNDADTDGDGEVGPLDPDGSQDADDEDDGDDAGTAPQQIDLQLVKTVNNSSPNVGEVVSFTITVDNLGPSDATGVAIEDIIPNGYEGITNINNGGSFDGSVISWAGLDIANGGNISLTYDATVKEPTTGISYVNLAEVTAADQDDVDSTPGNGADTDGDGEVGPLDPDGSQDADDEDDGDDAGITPQQIDLELTKTVNDEKPNVGQTVTFNILVENLGPNNATGVAIEDVIPNGYSSIDNISDDGSLIGSTITWSNFDIAAGSSITVSFDAIVNEPTSGIDYLNIAQVTAADQDDVDSTPDNDNGDQSEDDEDNAGVEPLQIDLELDKRVDNRRPLVGGTVTFTIDLVNKGPDTATDITVFDPVPSGYSNVELVSFDGTAQIANVQDLVWKIPSLDAGEAVSISFTATVNAVGNYTNLAQVFRAGEDDIDSTPGNGVDTDDDNRVDDDNGDEDDGDGVVVDPIPVIDLELDKTVSNATPDVGSNVVFTITVINQGPSAGSGIVVTDKLPTGYSFVSSSAGADYNASTGDWSLGSLGVGETATLDITATVLASGNYTNLAEVSDMNEQDIDSTPDNGVDTDGDGNVEDDEGDEDDGDGVLVDPNPIADLELEKSADVEYADAGDIVTFTIALTNAGPSTATGVKVEDQLQSGFTFQSASTSQGSFNETTSEWTVGTLLNGQTEFLYITAVVNNQGAYYNLAEVTAANEDDKDSTPDNGVDTDGDGDFDDDFGDEDDGDGAEVDVDCDLTGDVVAIHCDDNGTPFDPTDDIFFADLSITGFGVGTSVGWSATVDNTVVGTGDYSGAIVTVGPFPISEGDVIIYAIDADDSGCRVIMRGSAPEPCSLLPCDLEAEVTNVACDDNGTGFDPADDVYYVSFSVTGSNNESWSAKVGDQVVLSGEHYNQNVTLGPFAISAGAIEINVYDDDVPDCGETFNVTPPAACSADCSVSVSVVNEPVCDDNGTPGDPSDDQFSFTVFVQGNNTAATTWTNNLGDTGNFGELVTYGPYPIAGGDIQLTFADSGNTLCRDIITVEAPASCSDACDLDVQLSDILCDDNGTPANPNDDLYTFNLTVDGLNVGQNGWAAVINNSVVATGNYGETTSFGPYNIISGSIQVSVHDLDDASCSEAVIVTPPTSCSEECSITVSEASTPECDDNGTAGDPSDDVFYVSLEVNGDNGSGNWNAFVGNTWVKSGSYGSTKTFGPFLIAGGPVRVVVKDAEDDSCEGEITVIPPASCSEECSITATLQNTICDDQGTPYDPSDDTYLAIVQVTGNNTGANWSSPELFPQFASYGAVVILGPYKISAGDKVVDFYDLGDATCRTSLFIDAPEACSDACLIDAVVTDVQCQDGGTADPSDDTFTFNVTVSGQYNFGNGWRTVGTDPIVNGQYGQEKQFGPYPIAGGAVSLKIADAQNITCQVLLNVEPPASCSAPDCEVVTNILEVNCDDNDTPTDPSDDVYFVEMSIDVVNSETAAAWTASSADGEVFGTGLFGTTAVFGPFAIAEGDVDIVVSDLADASCSSTTTVEAPATCSDLCAFVVELSVDGCDNQGTDQDASDDVYSFSLKVEGQNVSGDNWVATAANGDIIASGAYGATIVVSDIAIGTDYNLTITDEGDANCGEESIVVTSPAPCSDLCAFVAELEVGECDDNGTEQDASDDVYSFSLKVEGQNVSGDNWVATAANGDIIASGAYGATIVVSDIAIGTDYNLTITDEGDANCGQTSVVVTSPTACSSACSLSSTVSNVVCNDNGTSDPADDTYSFDLLVSGTNVSGVWMATLNGTNIAAGNFDEVTTVEGLLISDGNISLSIKAMENAACGETIATVEVPDACSVSDCNITAISIVEGPTCDSETTYEFTVLVEGQGDGWITQDGSITGAFNVPVTISGQAADGQIQKFLIDEIGVEGCTRGFEVQAPTAGQCTDCDLTANVTDIICNDNGTTDPADDTFVFSLTVTDGELEGTGWTSTGGEGFSGNFAESQEFGPFSIVDGNINFIIASDLNPSCELAIFIPVPETCSTVCEVTAELTDVNCNDAGTPDVLEDDIFLATVLITGNEAASMGWRAESLNGQMLSGGAYGTEGTFGPFSSIDGIASIIFIDMMDSDCRDTLQIDPAQYCSMMIVDCPESNYYCPILEADTYMIPTDPYDCVATAELPLPVVTLAGCAAGYTVLTELVDAEGVVIATIQDGEDRTVENMVIGNYTLRYTVTDGCDGQAIQECLMQVADKEYPTAICIGDLNVSLGSQGGVRLTADQIDFGSYDNCGIASVQVRRKSMIDPVTCEPLTEPIFSAWGPQVEFSCCDANTYVTVELLVTDISGNENTCWLDVLVEDKIKPVVFGLENQVVDCAELPSDFDPADSTHLASLFGWPRVFDNCEATIIEMNPILDISDCGSGTITRRFKAVDAVGNESVEVFEQLIEISYELGYEIGFPEDTETDCIFNAHGIVLNKLGCDSITVTYIDEFLAIEGTECVNLMRTYSIINHCEWDGVADPVVISRDEDCDNLEGNEGVFVIVSEDGAFIDRDIDIANGLPLAGTKGDNCDNTTNPAGYWRALVSTGSWQYSQQIKIFDNTAPIVDFTEPDPTCTVELACDAEVIYPFTVTEGCLTDQLQFTLELDAGADGTIDADLSDQGLISGTYPDYTISGSFPVGNHRFELSIEDACGNLGKVSMPFSVVDCYVPEPNCFDGFEAVLTALTTPVDVNNDGILDEAAVEVFAAELASCNVEDCSAPLRFSVNRVGEVASVDQTTLMLTCEDRYRITVEVYVWDNAFNPYAVQPDGSIGGPNYKYCTAEVIIRDPNEVCNDCEEDLLLEGSIMTEAANSVEDVSIILEGPVPTNTATETNGSFEFIGMEENARYTIRPFKDGDDRNGITTLDVLLIQNHLLGGNTLDTPYKLIAADVNQSGTLTTLDLLQLRALLLGDIESFPQNTSWRFVDRAYEFPQANNPWSDNFPESITTEDLTSCQFDLDFVAIKVGDVNGTAKANQLMSLEERGAAEGLGFELKDQFFKAGKTYTVDFKTNDLADILGYQFALTFDPSALLLQDIQYGVAQEENFGLTQLENGLLLTSWNHNSLEPIQADPDNKPIVFSLVFKAKTNGKLKDLINVSDRSLAPEAYDLEQEKVGVEIGFNTGIYATTEPVLYQNFPNPFRQETRITFELPEAASVKLAVQDVTGKVVKSISGKYDQGEHTLVLDGDEIPTGVLYYTLEVGNDFAKTKKMIRIEQIFP